MHRVFSVLEVFGLIICSLHSKNALYQCLFVCKEWCRVVLDALWEELDDALPLAALLGRLVQSKEV